MTRLVGNELPPDLLRRLSPDQLERHADKILLILSVDAAGWPHPAMLSHCEVVARDAHNVRLATYADSNTTANLRRDGRLTMVIVDEGIAYYLKGTVHELRARMTTAPHNALFNFQVERVLADHADVAREGEAAIAGGMTYGDPDLSARLASARMMFGEMLA